MKRKKLLTIVLSLSMAMTLMAGCKETDEQEKDITVMTDFDGTWVNEEGDVLLLDSESRSYTLQRFGGRVGKGDYDNHGGEMMFSFDTFLYGLTLDGDTLQVEQNGWEPDSETLEGPFIRDNSIEIISYTLSDLDGFWSNGDDEMFQIDSESGLYAYKNASQATSEGNIADDGEGRGPYMFLGDGEEGHAHFVVTTSDFSTFSLQPFEGMVKGKGTFTRIDAEEFEWAFGVRINRGG